MMSLQSRIGLRYTRCADLEGKSMRASRREFVKWGMASGIVFSLSRLAAAQEPLFAARETLPGRGHWNPAAAGMGRIDGVAKVAGAKLYASDFRAADLPGWPTTTSHAMLIRAPDATHVYTGIDLARLNGAAKPSVVVDARRSRAHRRACSRILCRRPVLPGRQDPDLSRPAGSAADLRKIRCLRSGTARAARWRFREIRRGNRPGLDAQLWRLPLHAHRRRHA